MSQNKTQYNIVRRSSRNKQMVRVLRKVGFGLFLVLAILTPVLYTRGGAGTRVHAAANNTINFQARLMNAAGAIAPDGNTYSVQFNLYSTASGGASLWTETRTGVSIKNGYLSESLGSVTPFGTNINWSEELWLTMNVNGDGEMNPRLRLTGVPLAFRAKQADGLVNGSSVLGANDLAQLAPTNSQVINSALAALRLNQTGVGGLIQFQNNGSDVFAIANNGNVTSDGDATFAGGTLNLGDATQAGGLVLSDGSSNTATIQSAGLSQDTVYTLPSVAGGSATICVSTGNCGGTGDIAQGGNSFGSSVTIGSNDNFGLNLETAGITRLAIDTNGNASLTGAFTAGTGLTVTSGGVSINGGINNNSGGLTNVGNLTGVGADITAAASLTVSATGVGNDLSFVSPDTISFDSTAGTAIQFQDAININGNLSLTGSVSGLTYMDFSTSGGNPSYQEGRLFYDNTQKALSYYNSESQTTLNIGQENYIYVYNNTASTITDGQAVYITGAQSGVPTIGLARANALTTANAVGIATHSIEAGTYGFVTNFGEINNLNTSTFAAGDTLYLSAATAGALTNTRPALPNYTTTLGRVTEVNAATGKIMVIVGDSRNGAFTAGKIAFGLADGSLSQNTNFHWDNTNSRLGIGDTTPAATLTVGNGDLFQVAGATGNIQTAGDLAVNGGDITSSGGLTITSGGSGAITLNSASNALEIDATDTTMRRIASGSYTVELNDVGNTSLVLNNTGTGAANLNLQDGGLQIGGTQVLGNNRSLTNLTGISTTGSLVFNSFSGTAGILQVDGSGNVSVASTSGFEVPLTFSNGLTRTGNAVTLGGNLTGATSLGLNTHALTLTGSSGNIQFATTGSATFGAIGTGLTVSNNLSVGGTINTNTFTGTGLTFAGAGATTIQAANNQGLTIQSQGSGGLTLTSGNGTIVLGSSTLQHSGSSFTFDLANAGTSTFNISNSSGSNLANLDVSGGLTAGSGNSFQVDNDGDVISVFMALNGTSTTTAGSGLGSSTSLAISNASNFDIGNYVQVNSANCGGTGINPCYAKITNKVGNTLTITPALTWANGSTVNEYHIPEIGGGNTTSTLTNRYGRGYFISGVATGNGTTFYNEDGIETSLGLYQIQSSAASGVINIGTNGNTSTVTIGSSGTTTTIAGNVTFSGNVTAPTTGTSGYLQRSGTTLSPSNSGDSFTTSGNISTSGSGTITANGGLTVVGGGASITGNSTISGSLSGLTSLTFTSGGINLNGGGVTNAGALSGITGITFASGNLALGGGNISGVSSISGTSLSVTGAITASTTTNTINGLIINSGALSGVSTINATGGITASTTGTINGLNINAGALSGISTISASGSITASTTGTINGLNISSGNVTGLTGMTFTSGSLALGGGNISGAGSIGATSLNVSGAISAATSTNTINGLIINAGALSGVSTISASGGITASTTGTINGLNINVGTVTGVTGLTFTSGNLALGGGNISGAGSISGTSLGVTGAISAATTTNTINGLIINNGALSGISMINATGGITASTTGTINGLNINAGTVTGITGMTFTSGNLALGGGNITGGGTITATTFSGALSGNASTASAFQTDPTDCAANQFARAIGANGALTCFALAANNLPSAAADLGAANITVNLGNTNGSFNTNLVLDGTITSGAINGATVASTSFNGVTIGSGAVNGLTISSGALTGVTGMTFTSGNLALGGGNITGAGSIAGASLGVTGAITAATTTNTINGLIINSGALSGISSISASGSITAATTGTINGLSINSGALTGITGATFTSGNLALGGGNISGVGTLGVGGLATLGAGANVTNDLSVVNGKVLIQHATAGASVIIDKTSVGGKIGSIKSGDAKVALFFDDTGSFSISKDTRTNISAGTGAGIDVFSIASTGAITVAGSISGLTTISASGAITAATTVNTINGLVINSGALSSVSGFTQNSGTFLLNGTSTITIGSGNNAFSINSSAFDVTSTGAVSGITTLDTSGNITTNGIYRQGALNGSTIAACTAGQYIGNGVRVSGGIITAGSCRNDAGLSDARLKKDVVSVGSVLDRIENVRVVTFNFKTDEMPEMNLDRGLQYGVIAQELEQLFPELVNQREDGYKEVNFQGLSFYNLRAVQELAQRVNNIEEPAQAASNEVKTGGVLRLDQYGAMQNITGLNMVGGGASLVGGLNNNNGGITNTGAISGVTTVSAESIKLNANAAGNLLELTKDNKGVFTVFNNGAMLLQLDSANIFAVKDAAGMGIFNIDSQSGRVNVGSGSDRKTVLFVLDNRSLPDDPPGTPGASYFNTKLERFRCYDGKWRDCMPAGDTTDPFQLSKVTWNMPAGDSEFIDTPRIVSDLYRAHEYRLRMRINVAAPAGATCRIQYASSDNGPWNDVTEGSAGELIIDQAGTLKTDWLKIKDDARKEDMTLRVMCKGGNGSQVIFNGVSMQLR